MTDETYAAIMAELRESEITAEDFRIILEILNKHLEAKK